MAGENGLNLVGYPVSNDSPDGRFYIVTAQNLQDAIQQMGPERALSVMANVLGLGVGRTIRPEHIDAVIDALANAARQIAKLPPGATTYQGQA